MVRLSALSMGELIDKTKSWIKKLVIDLNLCPFAAQVFNNDLIRYKVFESALDDEKLIGFFEELKLLKKIGPKKASTSFILYPTGLDDFEKYLDFLGKAEFILKETKMDNTFQLASFHPNYQFEGTQKNDISNATNQSPYPMLHILRINQVSQAIDSHPDINAIPVDNIKKLEKLGIEGLKGLLS